MKNKEIVAAYYSAFNRKDKESLLSLLSADVIHDINQGKREIGIDAFRDFLGVMDHHYDEEVRDLVVLHSENGSRAAAEFTIVGKYKHTASGLPTATGQTYSLPVGAFFEIKNGKISRVTNYYNLNDWIEQVSK